MFWFFSNPYAVRDIFFYLLLKFAIFHIEFDTAKKKQNKKKRMIFLKMLFTIPSSFYNCVSLKPK